MMFHSIFRQINSQGFAMVTLMESEGVVFKQYYVYLFTSLLDFGYTHVAASCHDSMARQAGTTAPIFFYIMCHSSSLYGINQCSADMTSVPILHLSVIVVIIARSIVLEIEFLHHSMFIRLNNNSYWSYNGTSA